MRREEIENRLMNLGYAVSRGAFWQWASARLIPVKVNAGQFAQWPTSALWEATAAAFLIRVCGWRQGDVRAGRNYMERPLFHRGDPVRMLTELMRDKASGEGYLAACGWLVTVIKAQLGIHPSVRVHLVARRAPGGGFDYTAEPALENRPDLLPEDFGPGLGFVGTIQTEGSATVHPNRAFLDRLADELLSE